MLECDNESKNEIKRIKDMYDPDTYIKRVTTELLTPRSFGRKASNVFFFFVNIC